MDTIQSIELDYLNPELFPDLESVRAFVEGYGIEAMLFALTEAAKPTIDEVSPPSRDVLAAATESIYFLGKDISELVGAYVEGKPVRAARGGFWQKRGRDALALLMLRLRLGEHVHMEILRHLVDPPAAPAAASEEAA
jgi:hypothetical protein